MLYLVVFGVGMSPMPWVVNSEIYPTAFRGNAISLSTGVNWISNYVVSGEALQDTRTTMQCYRTVRHYKTRARLSAC